MKTPVVKSCLVFDLKTGGLIIGWLGIFNSIWSAFVALASSCFTGIGLACLYLLLNTLLIEGIVKNKPSNILPALVLRAISFAVHVFLIFVAPIAVIMFLVYVERYSDSKKVWVSPHQVIFLLIGYYGLCISAVFDAYFIIVKYSLYKKIKQATVERERGFDLSTFPRTDI